VKIKNELMEDWIEIGTIVAPQGIRGELRVNPSSDFPERFEQPGKRWLQSPNQEKVEVVELLGGYQIPGKLLYIVQLEGINDRTQAENLRGYKLLVEKSDRLPLEEDEYHVADLIDLEVYHHVTGEKIGAVSDVFSAGNDLLEVTLNLSNPTEGENITPDLSKINRKSKLHKFRPKKQKTPKVLIPFVKEIVPIVNLKAGRIEITPPQGLLELNQTE
jgi:16S rRNA processing protein RimM